MTPLRSFLTRTVSAGLLATTLSTTPAAAMSGYFWTDWIALWNGDLTRAHTVMPGGNSPASINNTDASAAWVGGRHMVFSNLTCETPVGPISQSGATTGCTLIAGHWEATITYGGGFPGVIVASGNAVTFMGTDVVREIDGKAVEYWLVSNRVSLVSQLGVGQ